MAKNFSDYKPYDKLWWYNSERRSVNGGYIVNDMGRWKYNFEGANVNEFHLDGTGTTSSNRNTTTLFTWANGCHTDIEYYVTSSEYTEAGVVHTRYNIQGKLILKGDDDTILLQESISVYTDTRAGSSLDSLILYSTCGAPAYQTSTGTIYNISGFYGRILAPVGPNYAQNPTGHEYAERDFFNRFTVASLQNVSGDASYNAAYNRLVDNGDDTPIAPTMPSDDTSSTGGGDDSNPDYNPFTDPIPFPDLPTIGGLSTGFITAYNPGINQLRLFGSKLWSDDFITEIKKIQNDPMEAVISLHMLPFNVISSGTANCVVGNYDSEISMPVISTQFMSVNGGEVDVTERFASALDYSPYTTAHIHIPFVGIVPLDIDYIMKKHLTLKYQVDVLTGGATAMLMCDNAILYSFPCNMAMTVPVSSSNHQALYREMIQTNAQIGHTIVAGATGSDKGRDARVGHGIVSSLESALNTVASKHSEVQKSGAITGVQGVLDSFETYLIFHRPVQSLADKFAHFKGFPCNITYTLSSLSGYTEVEYAHLEGVTALDAEKDEIQALLQSGVIL